MAVEGLRAEDFALRQRPRGVTRLNSSGAMDGAGKIACAIYFAAFTNGCVHAISTSPATLALGFGFVEMIFART